MNKYIAPAKININLHITGKDEKGYHILDSLVCFTEFGDEINITLRNDKQFNLSINGEYGQGLSNTDNLIIKGAELIMHQFDGVVGADIVLTKNIPIASGVGGGSSDCATTIKALLQLWNKNEPDNLNQILLLLGADVPVCYYGNSCIMRGVGEDITQFELPKFYIILANPNVNVSTGKVFAGNIEKSNPPSYDNIDDYKNIVHNDLQNSAIKISPEISELLNDMEKVGANCVGMSGSGATCFALFNDEQSAKYGFEKIDNKYWKVLTKVK